MDDQVGDREQVFNGNSLGYLCKRMLEENGWQMKEELKSLFNESWLGNQHGTHTLIRSGMGLPTKKLLKEDLGREPKLKIDWIPQSIHQSPKSGRRLVLYKGFSPNAAYDVWWNSLGRYSLLHKDSKLREELIKSINLNDGFEFITASSMVKERDSVYWSFLDLEYFINEISRHYGRSIILFLLVRPTDKAKQRSEMFANNFFSNEYLFDNVISGKTLEAVQTKPSTSEIFIETTNETSERNMKHPSCLSSKCRCLELCAGTEMNIVLCDDEGNLIMNDNLEKVVTVQCTNACGCDIDCMTRSLEKGQQVPIVAVVKQGLGDIEIRAAADIKKGAFIMEHVGVVRVAGELTDFDTDDTFIIDSRKMGNLSKYLRIDSEPNALMVRVYIRGVEIQRRGVFASQDIKKGSLIKPRSTGALKFPWHWNIWKSYQTQ